MTPLRSRRQLGSDRLLLAFAAALMMALAVSTLYPLLFTVNIALKTSRDFILTRFAPTWPPSLENFIEAWELSQVDLYFMNSLVTTAGAVALLMFLSSLAGFAIARLRFRFRYGLFLLILAGLMVPVQVIMVPFFHAVIDLGLLNSRIGMILVYTAFNLPFSVYLMTAYYTSVPRELLEAARIDGAGLWAIYLHVMVPMGMPALVTVGILGALHCWNDVLLALLVLQDQDKRTLMVGIAALRGEYTSDIPLIAASAVIGAVPVLLIYLIFQRRIVGGLAVGAVKG